MHYTLACLFTKCKPNEIDAPVRFLIKETGDCLSLTELLKSNLVGLLNELIVGSSTSDSRKRSQVRFGDACQCGANVPIRVLGCGELCPYWRVQNSARRKPLPHIICHVEA